MVGGDIALHLIWLSGKIALGDMTDILRDAVLCLLLRGDNNDSPF